MFKAAARLSSLFVAVVALSGALALSQPAQAGWEGEIATRAFTNHPLALYTGPGEEFEAVGTLPGGLELRVDRCHVLWCQVHGRFGHGWVFLYALSFGQGPNSVFWPAEVRHPGVRAWWW